jgi:hypothetical protein
LPHPINRIRELLHAAAVTQDFGRHRLQIAVEFRDDLIAALLILMLAFPLELGKALGSPLGLLSISCPSSPPPVSNWGPGMWATQEPVQIAV